MKLDANRPQDLDDIISIRDAVDAGTPIDLDYLRAQATKLGVVDRLLVYFGEP
ncbi:MAG: hypothetical protein HYV07_27345 [Deltaproteobacteria bacterium]|nr:hypothetical protein [Deltaproteobacteria bacterium]